MSHENHETSTGASRILFLNSEDGVNISGDPSLTTDFSFQLEQPIIVPRHHAILMSLHRTSIPNTFYNFKRFRNCALNVSFRYSGSLFADVSNLDIQLEQGNYNALDLVSLISTEINNWLNGASDTQLGTITNPLTGTNQGLLFFMRYNRSELKFEWILSRGTNTTQQSYFLIFKWDSGNNSETSIKSEVGFIDHKWINSLTYDFFCELQLEASSSVDIYRWGAIKNGGGEGGDFYTLKFKYAGDYTNTNYKNLTWSGNIFDIAETALPDGTFLPANTLKPVFSAVDVKYHTRSIYIKTNLTQHSVLNSRHGGRFSSILARLPNDVASGETLEINPHDGIQHKLFLKVREIDKIFVRLTDVNNRLIDLNGLDWNLSLQFDFIQLPEVQHQPPNLREDTSNKRLKRQLEDEEKRIRATGKKKELDKFLKIRDTISLPDA
jgi:hypothetical protein